jgi:hypothetical protein
MKFSKRFFLHSFRYLTWPYCLFSLEVFKIRNDLDVIFRGLGEDDSLKKHEAKISRTVPLTFFLLFSIPFQAVLPLFSRGTQISYENSMSYSTVLHSNSFLEIYAFANLKGIGFHHLLRDIQYIRLRPRKGMHTILLTVCLLSCVYYFKRDDIKVWAFQTSFILRIQYLVLHLYLLYTCNTQSPPPPPSPCRVTLCILLFVSLHFPSLLPKVSRYFSFLLHSPSPFLFLYKFADFLPVSSPGFFVSGSTITFIDSKLYYSQFYSSRIFLFLLASFTIFPLLSP